ncbi:MAG: hypothetical protein ACK4PR_05240 [Gammaproteobacteria bacterium]
MSDDSNQVFAITQVNIRFIAEQDRLLFSMNTVDKNQFQFYFTRRWTKLFWQFLTKILEAEIPNASFDTNSKDAAVAFQHEAAMADADYETPFEEEGVNHPWGDEPLIATEVRLREPPMESPSIGIYNTKGVGLEFACGHKILHYFYQVLPDAVVRAEWDLILPHTELATIGPIDSSKLN